MTQFKLQFTDLHRNGTNGNPMESLGFPQKRVQMLRECRGMEIKLAGWNLLFWERRGYV